MTAARPLATESGAHLFRLILATDQVWRELTRPQRELLLSTAAGAPIKARTDVTRRLIERDLLVADPIFPEDGYPAALTDAGRLVIRWRPPQ